MLDLAAGTATSSAALARTGADVVGCDFSPRDAAGRRAGAATRASTWSPATRCGCRSATASFDAVTISFGLRNTADPDLALRELLRVTRPGGRLVVCEFSHPVWRPFRTVYVNYLMRALPAVARRVSSDPAAYVYLAESIRAWPVQAELAADLAVAGWDRGRLARPHRRHRRAAPGRPAGLTPAPAAAPLSRARPGRPTGRAAARAYTRSARS